MVSAVVVAVAQPSLVDAVPVTALVLRRQTRQIVGSLSVAGGCKQKHPFRSAEKHSLQVDAYVTSDEV